MKTLIGFIAISIIICLLTVTIFCLWNFSFVNWQLVSQVVNTTCAVSGSLFIVWLCCRVYFTERRFEERKGNSAYPKVR
ncbi:hypothetical protein [Pinibacter aurantiacus]|uniref:hypothetical protein n=1 Tax=Pinibacter aurantiacus TaxID=2851599 RepID=UPI001C38ADF2|nr:hypothetical protein [Pinibacter aurantiacus]